MVLVNRARRLSPSVKFGVTNYRVPDHEVEAKSQEEAV
jgi:hypothetical protein